MSAPSRLKGGVIDTNAGRRGFCPRRTVLDKLLVDAAVQAGAELREEFTVVNCQMVVLRPRLGTLVGTLRSMPMCAF
jgi:flavin-dependent dehydrogenase